MEKEIFWSQHAKKFDQTTDYVVGKQDVDIIKEEVSRLNDLGDVFEAACGTGMYTQLLLPHANSILATDFSNEMVEISKERFKQCSNVTVEQANIKDLQYPKESFDTVFVGNILHVVDDHELAFDNCLNLVKVGGRIICLDYCQDKMRFIHKVSQTYRFLTTYGKPTVKPSKPNFKLVDMIALFNEHNLQIEKAVLLGKKSKAVLVVGKKVKQ